MNKQKQIAKKHKLLKLKTVHEIDSVYFGSINQSYQKQGFGIQQTSDFQTYFGNWKNNKADGIGLIIYPSGGMIYGHFVRDQLDGICILDNKAILRVGIFDKLCLIGIGFEYEYRKKVWKMLRYHKGVPIQIVKQETQVKDGKIPKIMNIQQSLSNHLVNYWQRNYFGEFSSSYFHFIDDKEFYGHIDEGGFYGLGVLMWKGTTRQVGFYDGGVLNGYGYKYLAESQYTQMGQYVNGRKEGLFYQKDNQMQKIVKYSKNKIVQEINAFNIDILRKKHKKYNFERKDFLSSHTTLPYNQFLQTFIQPQVMAYKEKIKIKESENTKRHISTQRKKIKSSQGLGRQIKSKLLDEKVGHQNNIVQKHEKTSVQIIKEKISNYIGLINRSSSRNKFKSIKWKEDIVLKEKQKDIEDEIGEQENPFSRLNTMTERTLH